MEREAGHTPVVGGIPRHQYELIMERRRSDEEIRLSNQHSLCPQVAADEGESTRHRPIDTEDGYPAKEVTENCLVMLGIAPVIDAFVDLAEGDDPSFR